jgi:hypothetical protein
MADHDEIRRIMRILEVHDCLDSLMKLATSELTTTDTAQLALDAHGFLVELSAENKVFNDILRNRGTRYPHEVV